MSMAGANAVESITASGLGAGLRGAVTIARDSSAGAKPDEAGGSGASATAGDPVKGTAAGVDGALGDKARGDSARAGVGVVIVTCGSARVGTAAASGDGAVVRTGTTGRSAIVEAALNPPSCRPKENTVVEA